MSTTTTPPSGVVLKHTQFRFNTGPSKPSVLGDLLMVELIDNIKLVPSPYKEEKHTVILRIREKQTETVFQK